MIGDKKNGFSCWVVLLIVFFFLSQDKTAAARCVPKFSASGMMNLGISGKLVKSNPLDMLKNLQKPQPQG